MINMLSSCNLLLPQQITTGKRNPATELQKVISTLQEVSKIIDNPQHGAHYFYNNNQKNPTNDDKVNTYFAVKNQLEKTLDKTLDNKLQLNRLFIKRTGELLLKCKENIHGSKNFPACNLDNNCSLKEIVVEAYLDFFGQLTEEEQELFCESFNKYGEEEIIYKLFNSRKKLTHKLGLDKKFPRENPLLTGTFRFNFGSAK